MAAAFMFMAAVPVRAAPANTMTAVELATALGYAGFASGDTVNVGNIYSAWLVADAYVSAGITLNITESGRVLIPAGRTLTINGGTVNIQTTTALSGIEIAAGTVTIGGGTLNIESGYLNIQNSGINLNNHHGIAINGHATNPCGVMNITGGNVIVANTGESNGIRFAGVSNIANRGTLNIGTTLALNGNANSIAEANPNNSNIIGTSTNAQISVAQNPPARRFVTGVDNRVATYQWDTSTSAWAIGMSINGEGRYTNLSDFQTALQAMLNNPANATINITGELTGVTATLPINIPNANQTVNWLASYSGAATNLITLNGAGTFKAAGGIIENTIGLAISGNNNSTITITGGTVRGINASGGIIEFYGENNVLSITGGTLQNNHADNDTVVRTSGTFGAVNTIFVSGNLAIPASGILCWNDNPTAYFIGNHADKFSDFSAQNVIRIDCVPVMTAMGGNILATFPSFLTIPPGGISVGGNFPLTQGTDYAVSGNVVTFSGSYNTGADGVTLTVTGATMADGRISVPSFTTEAFGVNVTCDHIPSDDDCTICETCGKNSGENHSPQTNNCTECNDCLAIGLPPTCTDCDECRCKHSFGEWGNNTATCGEDGEEYRRCTGCGYEETQAAAALSHTWETNGNGTHSCTTIGGCGTVEACSPHGNSGDVCAKCGFTTPDLECEHENTTAEFNPAPTCATGGAEVITCDDCGEIIETENQNGLGHTWGEWEITTTATSITEGVETRICTRADCNEYETRAIPATGGDDMGGDECETCGNEPCTCSVACAICGNYQCTCHPAQPPSGGGTGGGGGGVLHPLIPTQPITPAQPTQPVQPADTAPETTAFAENVRVRLSVQIGSNIITDLAGNSAMQIMDVVPIIQDGRTLLPLRFLVNALGADIDWNEKTSEVTITLDGRVLTFTIGEITYELVALGMDVPPQIIDGRTMVPLRFISEFFGAMVSWDEVSRKIEIIM